VAIRMLAASRHLWTDHSVRHALAHQIDKSTANFASASLFSGGLDISIVNGEQAAECALKWQVGLKSSARGRLWCGGMLITPEWVLTAAYSMEGELQNGVYVAAGEHNVPGLDRHSWWITHGITAAPIFTTIA